MTIEEAIRLVFSFLGGGLVAGLLNWIRANKADRIARKVSALRDQVHNLYGPLHFFATQNESFFEINTLFHNAYSAEFAGKNWSQDPTTQKNLKKETSETRELRKAYIDLVTRNNDSILEILRDNFAHIDEDDIDVFRRFMVDYTRHRTEIDEDGCLKTPLRIYEHIGDIWFMRPEFIERVAQKFKTKRNELAAYSA